MKDVLTKVVSTAVRGFEADYVEVRAQELSKTAITTKEARVEAAKQGIENGAALRALVSARARMAKLLMPLRGPMLVGDIFQVLADVTGLANNERKIGQLFAPWILV